MNKAEQSSSLGKPVVYKTNYSPDLLFALPRKDNRILYAIEETSLPFIGWDVWHAYEASFLTEKGLPIIGVLKLAIPCNSPFLVESKSLKLYLNSFNMEEMGTSVKEATKAFISTIEKDISKLLKTTVKAHFHQNSETSLYGFENYPLLEAIPEAENILFERFQESPDLLEIIEDVTEANWGSHLLRSNCKVTYQPDWGSVYIHFKGEKSLKPESLLQYIVSFRTENHFHEEVCEMIYKRLLDRLKPDELSVTCVYTRRGGIDICPQRASHEHLLHTTLISPETLNQKLLRQ
jgi:7-cyano-7-deazaguanine reductase